MCAVGYLDNVPVDVMRSKGACTIIGVDGMLIELIHMKLIEELLCCNG